MGSYYTKLKKIARHANIGDDEFHRRFLGGLFSDNQMEVHRMGFSRPIDEIFSSLEEIERYKAELVSGANPSFAIPTIYTTLSIVSIGRD